MRLNRSVGAQYHAKGESLTGSFDLASHYRFVGCSCCNGNARVLSVVRCVRADKSREGFHVGLEFVARLLGLVAEHLDGAAPVLMVRIGYWHKRIPEDVATFMHQLVRNRRLAAGVFKVTEMTTSYSLGICASACYSCSAACVPGLTETRAHLASSIERLLVPELTLEQVLELCRSWDLPNFDADSARAIYALIGGIPDQWDCNVHSRQDMTRGIMHVQAGAQNDVAQDAYSPQRCRIMEALAQGDGIEGLVDLELDESEYFGARSFHFFKQRLYAHSTAHLLAMRARSLVRPIVLD